MEELAKMIGNLGFPIAVASFLLIRIEKQLNQLNQTMLKIIELLPKQN
ncbi:MAG: YvrJ family protein [Bacillota bacterium]